MRFRAFAERVGPRIFSLESVDYFGTSEQQQQQQKNRRLLISKTSMVRLTGLALYANESFRRPLK